MARNWFSAAPTGNESTATPESEPRPEPLSNIDRFYLQFIFDSQPKRKEQYLKQKGWQVNPKDENQIKPIGSNEPFEYEIDPGGYGDIDQYLTGNKKGNAKTTWAGLSEAGKDVGEGILDMIQGALIEGSGDVGAAMAGSGGTLAGPVGTAGGIALGRGAGRAAAYNVLENAKDLIGDTLLDKDIPPDMQLRFVQTAIQSVAPEALNNFAKGSVNIGKKVLKGAFDGTGNVIRKMVELGGGKIDQAMFDEFKADPWKFIKNPSLLKRAGATLDSVEHSLFGISPEEKIPDEIKSSSLFGKKLSELDAPRRAEANSLSANPQADTTLKEALNPIESKITELNEKAARTRLNGDEKAGLDKLKEIKGELLEKTKQGLKEEANKPAIVLFDKNGMPIQADKIKAMDPSQYKFNFGEMDELVRSLQNDMYKRDTAGNSYYNVIKSVVDGNKNDTGLAIRPGMNDSLKEKATALGSNYADIKGQEAKVFDAFETARTNIKKGTLSKYLIGGEDGAVAKDAANIIGPLADQEATNGLTAAEVGIANSGANRAKQGGVTNTIAQIDDALGTNLSGGLRDTQLRSQLWDQLNQKGSFGSGAPLAVAGTVFGMAQPLNYVSHGLGTAVGAIAAPIAGALSTPKIGLPAMGAMYSAGASVDKAGNLVIKGVDKVLSDPNVKKLIQTQAADTGTSVNQMYENIKSSLTTPPPRNWFQPSE